MLKPPAKILIVDDELANIELIADIFANDYEVLFAMDGEKALSIATAVTPDIILLDVLLPGMDGFEVCSRLKSDPITRAIPVIFITGLGDIERETQGLELGAVDYIAKPINPHVVRLRVNNQIALQQAQQQLARLATTDGLTGLANRRRFDEVLALEFARCSRRGGFLGLIMLDIDYFKSFNDTYGHVCGDDCLRSVAQALTRCLFRPSDLAARYGGEEFACILPDVDTPEGGLAVAERIRQSILDLKIPHSRSPTDCVTISLGGVSLLCTPGRTPIQLVSRADQQLYRAKSEGRNQVHFVFDMTFK